MTDLDQARSLVAAFRFRGALEFLRGRGGPPDESWCERTQLEVRLLLELEGVPSAIRRAEERAREAAEAPPGIRARVLAELATELRIVDPSAARAALDRAAEQAAAAGDAVVDHRVRLARVHLAVARDDQVGARTALSEGAGDPPPDLSYETRLAEALYEGTRTEGCRAIRELALAAARDPLQHARAVALLAAEDLAIEESGRALALLEPEMDRFAAADGPVAIVGMLHSLAGVARLLEGRDDDAERAVLFARATAPSYPVPSLTLAVIHARRGDPDRAEEALAFLSGRALPPVIVGACAAVEATCAVLRRDLVAFDDAWSRYVRERSLSAPQVDLVIDTAASRAEQHGGRDWLERAAALRRIRVAECGARLRARHVRALRRLASKGAAVLVGPFTLGGPIARGGFGEVRRARTASGLDVAVKLLPTRDEHSGAMLQHELHAVAKLDHPHVIRLLHFGTVDPAAAAMDPTLVAGTPWLAMELVEGGTVARRLGGCTWADARRWLLALLDGLAHAHARGVLHLDVKPSNLLLASDGLRIADFGLASVLGRTATAGVAGTAAYLAPEIFRGEPAGPWSDLYAVGCVAVALITGAPPFAATTLSSQREAHLTATPVVTPTVPVPAGLAAWILRLMAKDPVDRYRTAADAARGLLGLGDPEGEAGARVARVATASDRAPIPEPHVPIDWRRRDLAPPPPTFAEAGLGLFGLRAPRLVGRSRERALLWAALREVHRDRQVRAAVVAGAVGAPAGLGARALAGWLVERALELGAADSIACESAPADAPGAALARAVPRSDADPVAFADHLAESAARRPLILRFDRPDAASLAVARELVRRPVPVLVVATGAPDDWDDLAVPVVLDALDATETRALLAGLLPFDPELEGRLTDTVRGHPGFAVQLATHLVESGQLLLGATGYVLRPDPAPLPATLDALYDARWALLRGSLSVPARRALAAVARDRVVEEGLLLRACAEQGVDARAIRARLVAGRFVVPHAIGVAWIGERLRTRVTAG